jgi:hypothetical protein
MSYSVLYSYFCAVLSILFYQEDFYIDGFVVARILVSID